MGRRSTEGPEPEDRPVGERLTRCASATFGYVLAIRDGRLTVTEVYAANRADALNTLTGDRAQLAARLWDTVDTWVPGSADAEATRKRYAVSFAALKRSGVLGAGALVGDLSTVDWLTLKTNWKGGGADWNHLRRAVSHFLAMQLGMYHAERLKMFGKKRDKGTTNPFPKGREVERVPDLPPALFWKIVKAAPEHAQAALVTIAALGLRVGEYLRLTRAHLMPHSFGVQIPGRKTEGSAATVYVAEAFWPYVLQGVPSPLQYKWLRLYWKRALKAAGADVTLRLHDLRHMPAQILTNEGMPEAKVQTMMRHATASMTRRYAKQRDKGEAAALLGEAMERAAAAAGVSLKTA